MIRVYLPTLGSCTLSALVEVCCVIFIETLHENLKTVWVADITGSVHAVPTEDHVNASGHVSCDAAGRLWQLPAVYDA